jgi:hypothetical protein
MFARTYQQHGHSTAPLGAESMSAGPDADPSLIDFFNVRVKPYTPSAAHDAARQQALEVLDGAADDVDSRMKLGLAALEVFADSVEALNALGWCYLQKAHACQLEGRFVFALFPCACTDELRVGVY